MANLAVADIIVLALYLAVVLGTAIGFAVRQRSTDDYYVAGRRLRSGWVALSILATQVSAISLLGAPAFVALQTGGGLAWLQYELAVPLAMIALIVLIVPVLRRGRFVTIYEYIETRFGSGARAVLAATFLLARGLASGVALYAVALPVAVTFDVSLTTAMIAVGGFAILYTTVGGIEADVFSDVLQFVVLVGVIVVLVVVAMDGLGGWQAALDAVPVDRARIIVWEQHGLGDGNTFGLWPMLIGGFFLYVAYYGVDQSQAQRYLSTPDVAAAQRALLLNGMTRFMVALLYCFLGLLLAGWVATRPDFAAAVMAERPDAIVPIFVLEHAPAGVRGLFLAGLLAAAMSTLDSNYNSLSAVTLRDVLGWREQDPRRLRAARLLTLGWGAFCTAASFLFARSTSTVIETVNQIGSLFYGPVLGVFVLGMLFRRPGGRAALIGLASGLAINATLWQAAPGVSWMWWNVTGFLGSIASGWAAGAMQGAVTPYIDLLRPESLERRLNARTATALLLLVFTVMFVIAVLVPRTLAA
jgi:SSS family solute:Na+ symporter